MVLAVKICSLALNILSRLLAMCIIATVIKGAYYAIMELHARFGAQYFSPVSLPVNSEINSIDYQCPEDLYAIM